MLLAAGSALAQEEEDFYRLSTIPVPEGIVLEVGGLTALPDGQLAVSTRRGEVWLVENPEGAYPHFRRFAHGLHEALGAAYVDGALLVAQRGELTRLVDETGDGRADLYQAVYSWPLEGNYHEYSYGPLMARDGSMTVALNLGWIGFGASLSPWRGWMLSIDPEGAMKPIAAGMRSPAGMGYTMSGDLFYAENQGDWVASGYLTHVETGDFVGNPAGLRWADQEGSPLALSPDDIPDSGAPMFEVAGKIEALKLPAVWLPHAVLGISTSDIVPDSTRGAFGPFAGQLLVGDQGHSKIARVFLEKVEGMYQGAAFPFREGFSSGVLRLAWGKGGKLYVGMTSRGWGSTGREPFGLQRLEWTGKMPFEMHEVRARPDGFEVSFTKPVDPAAAGRIDSYGIQSFTYHYHSTYGSPPIRRQAHDIAGVVLSPDRRSIRVAVAGLRQGYIYEILMPGIRSLDQEPLLHDAAYYTLNRIPGGEALAGLPKQEETAPSVAEPKNQLTRPAAWTDGTTTVLTVGTRPNLRFDVEELVVPAGSRVALTFVNDDDMLHNLVITREAAADSVALDAMRLGLSGHDMAYVPASEDVLFHTGLLEPGAEETVYFTAPVVPGGYPFVCTFPGHAATMRGILRVTRVSP